MESIDDCFNEEEAIMVILSFGTLRPTSLQEHLPLLPVTLKVIEEPPLSPSLKEWIIRQVYTHYLAKTLAIHSLLSLTSSMERRKTTDALGDSSASS
jgi:hypothetical protein